MKGNYTPRMIGFINNILENTFFINKLEVPVFNENIENSTIVEIGTNAEEKLFLLNAIVKETVEEYRLDEKKPSFNTNSTNILRSVSRILQNEIEPGYYVEVEDIPEFVLPCTSLSEAEKLAGSLSFKSKVLSKE